LRTDKEFVATQEAYRKYIADMLELAGVKPGAAKADAIYDLEHKIAEAHWPNADRRDEDKTYNPMSVSELEKLAPDFPWRTYLAAANIPAKGPKGERRVIVAEKDAFPKLAAIFAATPIEVWRDYLTVHYLHAFSAVLPTPFDKTDFA